MDPSGVTPTDQQAETGSEQVTFLSPSQETRGFFEERLELGARQYLVGKRWCLNYQTCDGLF
jgi:hypothetical protein